MYALLRVFLAVGAFVVIWSLFRDFNTVLSIKINTANCVSRKKTSMSTESIMATIDSIVKDSYMPPSYKYSPSEIARHEAVQVARMQALRKSLIEEAFCHKQVSG